jgi:hypothetical protein
MTVSRKRDHIREQLSLARNQFECIRDSKFLSDMLSRYQIVAVPGMDVADIAGCRMAQFDLFLTKRSNR